MIIQKGWVGYLGSWNCQINHCCESPSNCEELMWGGEELKTRRLERERNCKHHSHHHHTYHHPSSLSSYWHSSSINNLSNNQNRSNYLELAVKCHGALEVFFLLQLNKQKRSFLVDAAEKRLWQGWLWRLRPPGWWWIPASAPTSSSLEADLRSRGWCSSGWA